MKFKKLAAIVLSTAALTACGSVQDQAKVPEAKDKWEAPQGLSGDLTFYSANPQGLTDDLVQAFKEKTHVNVNVFSGETGKITARLEAEKANPKADLVYLASENAAKKQARTDAYEEFTLEGADKIHEGWAKGKYTGRDGSALALVVSTKATDQHLADWEDLTKPEFKDKVIMPDPRESGTAADLVSAMVEKFGEQKTWDLFSRLFANGMVVQGANGPALDAVTSGSKAVVLGGVDYSAYAAKAKGEPLEVGMPSSGTSVTPRPVMILKTAKNKAAAEAFTNFMFSPEGQAIAAKHYMIPARTDVKPAEGKPLDELQQLPAGKPDVRDKFAEHFLK